jgi:uncharacterized membrane protein YozB (DUF420 family)
MDWLRILPAVNATLNGLSAILLLIGYVLIRQRRIVQHRFFMLAACTTSTIFLASYLTYHFLLHGLKRFGATGFWRGFYFVLLTTHTILAVVVLPLVIITALHALRARVPQHRRIARITFPIWMYVSITGVLVYLFLYQWFPAAQ